MHSTLSSEVALYQSLFIIILHFLVPLVTAYGFAWFFLLRAYAMFKLFNTEESEKKTPAITSYMLHLKYMAEL